LGKRRLSAVDLERARMLHHYPLHQCRPNAERLTDLQYAHAALVEAQDALQQPCSRMILERLSVAN
jgi:hypothetical protein